MVQPVDSLIQDFAKAGTYNHHLLYLLISAIQPFSLLWKAGSICELFKRTAGASYITFHPEASNHVHRSLSLIRSLGCRSGLVLTPSSSLEHCRYVLDQIDIILIMSVNPGFGGQSFIQSALDVSVRYMASLESITVASCVTSMLHQRFIIQYVYYSYLIL